MTLSPDDRRLLGCSVYAVAALYVRPDRLITRAMRLVESLGGVVLDVDEENRVVRANLSGQALRELSQAAKDLLAASGIEVKVTCRLNMSLADSAKHLLSRGFKLEKSDERVVGYGVVEGRYVEVEVTADGKAKLKIGRRTPFAKSKRVTSKLPPGLFLMSLDEAVEAVGEALRVAGAVFG